MCETIEFLGVKYLVNDSNLRDPIEPPDGYEYLGRNDVDKTILISNDDGKLYLYDADIDRFYYMAESLNALKQYFIDLSDPIGESDNDRAEWVRDYLSSIDPKLTEADNSFWATYIEELGYGLL